MLSPGRALPSHLYRPHTSSSPRSGPPSTRLNPHRRARTVGCTTSRDFVPWRFPDACCWSRGCRVSQASGNLHKSGRCVEASTSAKDMRSSVLGVEMSYDELTPTSVIAAAGRLKGYVLRTPLDASRALSEASGASEVHLKLENLQRTGSLKIRGALNRLFTLDERERALGVVAASAGNHALGVAEAATVLKLRATLIVPKGASSAKIAALRRYSEEQSNCWSKAPTTMRRSASLFRSRAKPIAALSHHITIRRSWWARARSAWRSWKTSPMFKPCLFPLEAAAPRRHRVVGQGHQSADTGGWRAVDSISFHESCVCGRASRDSPGYGQPSGWHFWKH